MDFLRSMAIAASGLRAQAGRMRVISENIANADSTAQQPGSDPYRRKVPTFRSEVDRALDAQVVSMGRVRTASIIRPPGVAYRHVGARRTSEKVNRTVFRRSSGQRLRRCRWCQP